MKIKLLVFLLFGILTIGQAQNTGSLSGKVLDKSTNVPISYATIEIKENGKMITGGVTDDKGDFTIKNIALKSYHLEIQFIGYKTHKSTLDFNASKKSITLKISLEEEATELKGVDIVSERSTIEQKIDRKIINVGKDLISAGATASEIMNNIPSVSVDPQTNAISLRGNPNVRILIDGKPTTISAAQLLQQIPSSSIKQIELITNPSAKYNPEGMSGIINIILNKNSRIGFNGSINNGVTFGKTPKLNSSFDMNYKTGKINMYANYGLNTGKYTNHGLIKVTEPGEENDQIFKFIDNNTSHLAKMGFDFYWNEKNTVSFYTTQNFYKGKGESRTTVHYWDTSSDIVQLFNNKNDNYNQTYNVDYKKNFKKEGHTIELEVNYSNNDNKEDAAFVAPDATNYITNKGNNTLINLDYTNPLSETAKLELGLESRIENTKNNFDKDGSYNSDFAYDRNIYSAYATFSKQWGKWSAQAGTRFEKYKAAAEFKKANENNAAFEDDLFTLYPSGFLNYSPSEKNTFNFSISRRVDRPSIDQVNPIREWSTPQIDSEGNPELFPQFTNSYELNYTRKTKIGSITSGVFYRRINNEITRTFFENPNNSEKLILSYANLDDNNAYGVEVSGNLEFTKWYNANISFDVYNKKTKGVVADEYVEVDLTIFNARMSNTFKPTKNLRLQLTGMYRGRDLGIQFLRKPMWKIDLGSSYTILKGSGTVTARFSDIFNTMNFAFEGSKPKQQNGQFNWESQSAYVGFNYRFGTGKNKALQRKERDKNETQGSGGF
jgi:outer membrane receptor protein involved in Fe transport